MSLVTDAGQRDEVRDLPVPGDGGLRRAGGPAEQCHLFSSLSSGIKGFLRHCDGWRH